MKDLKQLIENFHLDWDKITETYQKDAREKTDEEIKTFDDWKKYLEESYSYWKDEGYKFDHDFYFRLSSIAKKHLDLIN